MNDLTYAIRRIAWAHIILLFNFNLGTINLIPDWLGYLFIVLALPILGQDDPSANLIHPLGILLTIWEVVSWLGAMFGITLEIPMIGILISIIELYFHFQLLTNLANIAALYYCPEHEKLLTLRVVRTILITLTSLPFSWTNLSQNSMPMIGLVILIVLVQFIVTVWICSLLFSLAKSIETMTQPME